MIRRPADELHHFAAAVLRAAGCAEAEAEATAEVVVWGSAVGRETQGLWRLPILARRLREGGIVSPAPVEVVGGTGAVELLDAGGGMGPWIGRRAVDRAVELAREGGGAGVVGVRNSNHFLAAGWYAHRMARSGMVGLVTSNCVPKVVAPGGRERILGTNPLAFAAPLPGEESLLVDMATAATSGSFVRESATLGRSLPPGVAVDADGRPTRDAAAAARGASLPVGGGKGLGLSLMVEVLSAVLTGAAVSREVGSMFDEPARPSRVGHVFLAVEVERFLPRDEFVRRMDELRRRVLESGPEGAVRLPGAVRWEALREARERGVPVSSHVREALERTARELGVATPDWGDGAPSP